MLVKIKLILKKIFFLFIVTFFIIFIFTNREFVEVNLIPFGYKIKVRSFLLMTTSFLMGVIFEYVCSIAFKIHQRFVNARPSAK
jgi:uncharacterized integral membrane protein